LVRRVPRRVPLDGLGDALLGVAQNLLGLRPPVADVPGRDLFGQRFGPRRDLLVEVGTRAGVRGAHARPVPGRAHRLHGGPGYTAESAVHWSHASVQSTLPPSRAESLIGVPVTSTGSP